MSTDVNLFIHWMFYAWSRECWWLPQFISCCFLSPLLLSSSSPLSISVSLSLSLSSGQGRHVLLQTCWETLAISQSWEVVSYCGRQSPYIFLLLFCGIQCDKFNILSTWAIFYTWKQQPLASAKHLKTPTQLYIHHLSNFLPPAVPHVASVISSLHLLCAHKVLIIEAEMTCPKSFASVLLNRLTHG